jgi:hypothetical protein
MHYVHYKYQGQGGRRLDPDGSAKKRPAEAGLPVYLKKANSAYFFSSAAGAVGAAAAGAAEVSAGALIAAGVSTSTAVLATLPPWIDIITGTISSATMLMILIKGLTAGPAVSL